MKYKAAAGASISQEKAQIVGEFLETLGEFTPSDVVEAARPELSPLHDCFEWDDLKAAEKYRLVEARHLVNTINVVITAQGKEIEARGFYSVVVQTEDEQIEHRYTAIRIISADSARREQVIERALLELQGWQARYQQYQEIFGGNIFEAIETVIRTRKRTAPRRIKQDQASLSV